MPGERTILSNDPDKLRRELEELGFADPSAAAKHVGDWRSGKARALRSPAAQAAFEAMLPGLMRAIAAGADPNHSLNRFADIVERLSSGVNLFRLLEARPQLAETFALILAHAPALSEQLARRPVLFDGLIDRSSFAEPPDAPTTAKRLIEAARGRPLDQTVDPLRRMIGERRFALGVQLIAGHRDPISIAEGYSDLAEGAIIAMTDLTAREFERRHGVIAGGELIVLALGRLGGRALSHAGPTARGQTDGGGLGGASAIGPGSAIEPGAAIHQDAGRKPELPPGSPATIVGRMVHERQSPVKCMVGHALPPYQ